MPRSKDLDTVAPDDSVDVTPDQTPPQPKDIPKQKSQSFNQSSPSSSKSPFRQKINEILGHTKTPFSSFLARPKVFNFEERDDLEEIILVLRRHWLTNLRWIFISIGMSLLPLVLTIIPLLETVPANYQFIGILFWYLLTFAFAFEQFLSWYFNVYIITDERVVDIDFKNLLNKRFSEAKLNMIQDITSQTTGAAQTVFNFGDILIQTAAEVPEIVFERVPNPDKVIKILGQLRQEEELEALEGRIR